MNWNNLLDKFNNKEATLIQIGANDGVSWGDEYLFNLICMNKNWKCILIEPIKENIDALKENYKYFKRDNIFFEQVAIGDKNSIETIWANISHGDHVFGALSTFKEYLIDFWVGHKFTPIEVHMKKFSYIKEKYNLTSCDIIQIDTEGFDLIILKEIFSSDLYPTIIKAELPNQSLEDQKEMLSLFNNFDYDVTKTDQDIICLKK